MSGHWDLLLFDAMAAPVGFLLIWLTVAELWQIHKVKRAWRRIEEDYSQAILRSSRGGRQIRRGWWVYEGTSTRKERHHG